LIHSDDNDEEDDVSKAGEAKKADKMSLTFECMAMSGDKETNFSRSGLSFSSVT
jgi:hypothetical protein